MKNILLIIAFFSCVISANAQVRPDQAIEKTTAQDTDEIYSQYNGLLRRIKFSTAKIYFQSGLTLLDLGISDGTNGQVLTTDGSGNFSFTTVSSGTDDQTLSFAGTTLSIEDGNSVDLSSLQDGTGTDDQTLSFAGTTLSIEDGNSVDLSSLQDGTGTDDQTAAEVSFSPTGNISSSDVQSMGEELQTQIDAIQTTSGVVNGATNLGTFSGSTISDNTTIKAALQTIETEIESLGGGGGSVWTNLDGTGATSSSTDIKYNAGQVGVGFEDSETLPSSKSLAVEGNMSIQREDGAGYTSLTGYQADGTTPVWQIHDKNLAMNLSLTDGGENLVITGNGVIVDGNVPRARLCSQHGSQWQLALQDDLNKATLVRHEDNGLTRIAFTDDGGSTTKDLFWRGNGTDISTTNSLTGVVGHINSIIKLTDNTDDDTRVVYTIPVISYKHTASIFFICDSSSENIGGDGCAVETADAVLINGSSDFILPELGKVYELRYSGDLGEWFIMNL